MYVPINTNEFAHFVRVCGHCDEVMDQEVGLRCDKCTLTIHEKCLEIPCKK